MSKNKSVLIVLLLLSSQQVAAYIGPGMGGGIIAAIVGFIAAILLGLWGILYYPIKRALRNRKDKKELSRDSNDAEMRSDDDEPH